MGRDDTPGGGSLAIIAAPGFIIYRLLDGNNSDGKPPTSSVCWKRLCLWRVRR